MNCPNCGAENEPEVRFCVECGTPLEGQPVPPPIENDDDNDKTIMSSLPLVAEEAKTVAVSSDDILAAAGEPDIEVESYSSTPAYEVSSPAYGSVDATPAGGDLAPPKKRNYLLIAIIAFIVLCCCCAVAGSAAYFVSGNLENIGAIMPAIVQALA